MRFMDNHRNGIGRREALRRLAAGGSAAALPMVGQAAQTTTKVAKAPPEPTALGSALPPDRELSSRTWKPIFFGSHQNRTVIALSDLIIPTTDTPGAMAAQVNRFIDLLLAAETEEKRKEYIEALSWLDGYCLNRYSNPFVRLGHEEQVAVLSLLTHPEPNPELSHGVKLFQIVKASIVRAYYTSEIGMLEELKYQTNPYQLGCPGCGCKNQPEYPKA